MKLFITITIFILSSFTGYSSSLTEEGLFIRISVSSANRVSFQYCSQIKCQNFGSKEGYDKRRFKIIANLYSVGKLIYIPSDLSQVKLLPIGLFQTPLDEHFELYFLMERLCDDVTDIYLSSDKEIRELKKSLQVIIKIYDYSKNMAYNSTIFRIFYAND